MYIIEDNHLKRELDNMNTSYPWIEEIYWYNYEKGIKNKVHRKFCLFGL